MKRFIPLLLVVAMLAGCGMFGHTSDPSMVAGKSLIATHDTIVNIHEGFRAPCKSGQVPAATCAKVDQLTQEAGPIFDAAVSADLLALQNGTPLDPVYQNQLNQLFAELTQLALKYSIKGGE